MRMPTAATRMPVFHSRNIGSIRGDKYFQQNLKFMREWPRLITWQRGC